MKRRLKEPFGKAGLTVGVIALVMALIGGAYAAGGLTKSQEKQVKKIAKKYAGKPGAPGATGPAGPAGAAGAKGAQGAPGEQGIQGEPGIQGEEGSPWTAGGTLPSKATETGVWSFETKEEGGFLSSAVASFAIPLKEPLPAVHYINSSNKEVLFGEPPIEQSSTVCLGTFENPTAKPGNFCIYTEVLSNMEAFSEGIAIHTAGAFNGFLPKLVAGTKTGRGSWAVTAP